MLTNTVILRSSGQILLPNLTAKSGSAEDIQDAVDIIAANFGAGNVYIPEGTFNFVDIGETWQTVTVPAGINIFGALTERDTDDQVIEWKTVLLMPSEVPTGAAWFRFIGDKNPNEPSRFSDVKLVGYRDINSNSISMHYPFTISSIINFRVDHCSFKHTCNGAFIKDSCGVLDHCRFVNEYGVPAPYDSRTVGYGIHIWRSSHVSTWDDITTILGNYLDYTVFIEDCYFSKWRHCICGNLGAHWVFRHNIIEYGYAFGDLDTHPQWNEPDVPNRAVEIYENQFLNPDVWGYPMTIQFWSGSGCIYNNTAGRGYGTFVFFQGPGWNDAYGPQDVYLWNNNYPGTYVDGSGTENVNYFLYQPSWYTAYQYPHPLTLETTS